MGSGTLGRNYLAIVNPAAGGGRSRKLLGPALERLRAGGIEIKVAETHAPGEATEIAREAYGRGVRHFIAVGGDGTSYEIVNGLFPQALGGEARRWDFCRWARAILFCATSVIRASNMRLNLCLPSRSRTCDVMRLRHRDGVIHYINLLSMGFSADVATLRARRFSGWGELGYLLQFF